MALGAGLIGSWIVPVNSNRAVPTTRASTMTAAIGANGRLNTSFAGTDSCARGCSRAANTASPYHALAFTTPASAATTSASAAGTCVITAPARVATPKLPSSQATARAGGNRRHQAVMTPPWLSIATIPSMSGKAARNGQEKGSTATPNASVAAGVSSTHATRVSAAQETNEERSAGACSPCGQASRSSAASSAARVVRTSATRPANHSQDCVSVNSQRRSW